MENTGETFPEISYGTWRSHQLHMFPRGGKGLCHKVTSVTFAVSIMMCISAETALLAESSEKIKCYVE